MRLNGWLRIGIVLAVVLALVLSANTIHEHASHVGFRLPPTLFDRV